MTWRDKARVGLTARLEESLRPLGFRGDLSILEEPKPVADDSLKLLLRDAKGRNLAVALCSSPTAPESVLRGVERSASVKTALGELGFPILAPLESDRIDGLTYVVVPYRNPLHGSRVLWKVQRTLLRPHLFRWLRDVNGKTVHESGPTSDTAGYSASLTALAQHEGVPRRIRDKADHALEALHAGRWKARHVLMHADLWKGNFLLTGSTTDPLNLGQRFVVIDWAGSRLDGYPMFDLLRLARSMGLKDRALEREVEAHGRVLECDPDELELYLLAAMGHILLNLECFPFERFLMMLEYDLGTLERVLSRS